MTEPLHDLIAQAVIDEIAAVSAVAGSYGGFEIRMSFEFYERFAKWLYARTDNYPTGTTQYPSFMGLIIHRDDWSYDWKIVPVEIWPPKGYIEGVEG